MVNTKYLWQFPLIDGKVLNLYSDSPGKNPLQEAIDQAVADVVSKQYHDAMVEAVKNIIRHKASGTTKAELISLMGDPTTFTKKEKLGIIKEIREWKKSRKKRIKKITPEVYFRTYVKAYSERTKDGPMVKKLNEMWNSDYFTDSQINKMYPRFTKFWKEYIGNK
jgi:hypothetical protein